MAPAAPRSNALRMHSGLMRLLQGARMIRTFGDILSRLVPARSAPVYLHQLQTNATTFSSKPAGPGELGSVEGDVGMSHPWSALRGGRGAAAETGPTPHRPVLGGSTRLRARH